MVVKLDNISKSYGGVKALKKATLELKDNDIRALLGGNGSGKSTLIKVVAGLVGKDEGSIYIDGKLCTIKNPKDAKAYKIVATSQELSILPNLTVGENITICDLPKKRGFTDQKEIRKQSMEILSKLKLEGDIDTPVSELPTNKQYLIEFGKAIYQDFDILLIDEVTSALYREDVALLKKILDEYKAQGKIILFVSHRLPELYAVCDSVTVMRNGEVIVTEDMKNVNDEFLVSQMIGRKLGESDSAGAPSAAPAEEREADEKNVFLKVRGLPVGQYHTTLDLDLCRGEIVGVAGLQGHGQSNIVRALHGLSPNGGMSLECDGAPIQIHSPEQSAKLHFAFVSGDRENEGAFRYHDIADNLTAVNELVLHRKKLSSEAVLQDLNVKYDAMYDNITSLSGGNQQKVVIGRWTCTKPRLILADDPSKGIDVQARNDLRLLLWKLAAEGTAIVFVSSDEDELVNLCANAPCARVIILYEGRIVKTLRGAEVTRDNIISASIPSEGDLD